MEWNGRGGGAPPPPLSLPPYSSEAACGRCHPSSSPSLPFSVLLSVSQSLAAQLEPCCAEVGPGGIVLCTSEERAKRIVFPHFPRLTFAEK